MTKFEEAAIACSKTPEYKDYEEAKKTNKEGAWEAVKATPEYKAMEEAWEARKKTFNNKKSI